MESVNIFRSSTFEDMSFARDSIHADVFPEFQEFCMLNDMVCNLIDLRWGVSKGDEKSKRVISRCLDDIEYCAGSPLFFVGIIGERYGWSPKPSDFGDLTPQRQAIIDESIRLGWSVTELECRYAEQLKGNTQTIYFISENEHSETDPKLRQFKDFLKSNGNQVILYKDQKDIAGILINILKDWLFDYCDICPEHRDIRYLIERYYGKGRCIQEICNALSVGSDWNKYHDINGYEYRREGVLAIDVYAHRKAQGKLKDALHALVEPSHKNIMRYLFGLLSISTPDGLSFDDIVAVLSEFSINEADIKVVFQSVRPFLREYRGRYRGIHPRLEGVEARGLSEGINPVLSQLIDYYQSNDNFIGDQHSVYAFVAKAKLNFFWRMGGASFGPNVLVDFWDGFNDLCQFQDHYYRRKNLVYSGLLLACCMDFKLYQTFCRRLGSMAKASEQKDFFVDMVEDENIQRDFPLLIHHVAKGLALDESRITLLSERHKNYRKLIGYVIWELAWDFNTPRAFKKRFESRLNLEHFLKDVGDVPPGSLLHQLLILFKRAQVKGEVPYAFKLFVKLKERQGLEA